jgi:hypothetical protein
MWPPSAYEPFNGDGRCRFEVGQLGPVGGDSDGHHPVVETAYLGIEVIPPVARMLAAA